MSRKEKWKSFGKNTGKAFKNFGQAVVKSANIAVGNEKNEVEDNGKTKIRNAWTKTGKGFGEAGTSLGKAITTTINGDEEAPKQEVQEEVKEEAQVEEKPSEENQDK